MFFILRPGSEAIKSLTLATYVTEEFFPTNCANLTTEGKKEWKMRSKQNHALSYNIMLYLENEILLND